MPKFAYAGINPDGREVTGTQKAANRSDADERINRARAALANDADPFLTDRFDLNYAFAALLLASLGAGRFLEDYRTGFALSNLRRVNTAWTTIRVHHNPVQKNEDGQREIQIEK